MNSLRSPRDDAAVSAESVQGTRALCESVAASRNLRFGGKPSSAVAASRRRNMHCYSHSSTDFQTRRETFRVYFCVWADVKDAPFARIHLYSSSAACAHSSE